MGRNFNRRCFTYRRQKRTIPTFSSFLLSLPLLIRLDPFGLTISACFPFLSRLTYFNLFSEFRPGCLRCESICKKGAGCVYFFTYSNSYGNLSNPRYTHFRNSAASYPRNWQFLYSSRTPLQGCWETTRLWTSSGYVIIYTQCATVVSLKWDLGGQTSTRIIKISRLKRRRKRTPCAGNVVYYYNIKESFYELDFSGTSKSRGKKVLLAVLRVLLIYGHVSHKRNSSLVITIKIIIFLLAFLKGITLYYSLA